MAHIWPCLHWALIYFDVFRSFTGPPLHFIHQYEKKNKTMKNRISPLAWAKWEYYSPPLQNVASPQATDKVSAENSLLLLLWPPHPIVSTIASEFLQKFHLPLVPPKCASWPLVNKPNGSHHEGMEGLYGNLLANPPQDRSDDNHGEFHHQ